MSLNFLESLVAGINARKGNTNCGHCALRFDEHVAQGKNLHLGPVPLISAQLYSRPFVKAQKIVSATTVDKRIVEKCATKPADYRVICDLNDESMEYQIDLTQSESATNEVRFRSSSAQSIAADLRTLSRRQKDGSAYGFIVLTHEKDIEKGHIINFYVDRDNQVYFIDAQSEQVTEQLNMQGFRPEIFYIASIPPEGFIIKEEKTQDSMISIKKEKGKELEKELEKDISAQISLIPDNQKVEFQALLTAAQNGTASVENYLRLGKFYMDTRAVLSDPKIVFECANSARECAKKALELDNTSSIAWHNLGLCYQNGWGIQPNLELAFKCYHKAVAFGNTNADALTSLGYCYLKGFGIKSNPGVAFQLLKKATECNNNNVTALMLLGECYYNGFGITSNLDLAFQCYEKVTKLDSKNTTAWSNLTFIKELRELQANKNRVLHTNQPPPVLPATENRALLPNFSRSNQPPVIARSNSDLLAIREKEISLLRAQLAMKDKEIEALKELVKLRDQEIAQISGKTATSTSSPIANFTKP